MEPLASQAPCIRFHEHAQHPWGWRRSDQAPLLLDFEAQPGLMALDPKLSPSPALLVGAAWPAGPLVPREVLIQGGEVRPAPVFLV